MKQFTDEEIEEFLKIPIDKLTVVEKGNYDVKLETKLSAKDNLKSKIR